jgi:hypothetical protein
MIRLSQQSSGMFGRTILQLASLPISLRHAAERSWAGVAGRKRKGVNFACEFRISSAKTQFRFHDSTITSSNEKPGSFGSQE